jgi:hypothetical protein
VVKVKIYPDNEHEWPTATDYDIDLQGGLEVLEHEHVVGRYSPTVWIEATDGHGTTPNTDIMEREANLEDPE